MPSNREYDRQCVVCDEPFTASRRDGKYCSHTCATRAFRARQKNPAPPPQDRRCEFCGKSIDHKRRDARFCDIRCSRNRWYYTTGQALKPRDGRTCAGCGEPVDSMRHPNATFCSLVCREITRRVAAHGITIGEYRQLLEAQDNACAICRRGEIRWKADLVRDGWHIDHDHITGKVRGVLCPPCNLILGYAKDDPEVLRRAAEYLT